MPRRFDEQDLVLLHALQIAPRAGWAELARALGSTAPAWAARWVRLRETGLAWVSTYPASLTDYLVAMVEVDCEPARRSEVVRDLCLDPRVVSVEEAAVGSDLILTTMIRDLPRLTRFLLEDLPRQPGVVRHQAHLATAIHHQGSDWRLDALDAAQRRAVRAARGTATAPQTQGGSGPPAGMWPLIEALAHDGRATAADLARTTGRNPATVRRQLARLLDSGSLIFRCEVAQLSSRWPVIGSWHARVPIAEHERTAAALSTLPELRLCLSTTGVSNLFFTVWARSLPDLLRIERLLGERLPWLELAESTVTLRTHKRMGWLLDEEGRCTGEVVAPDALRD